MSAKKNASYRQPPHATVTIAALLDAATRQLTQGQSSSAASAQEAAGAPPSSASCTPRLDAEVILGHVVGMSRTRLLTWSDRRITPEEEARFQQLLARRLRREPVAYIVGRREFYDLILTVTPDVLIPRAETEVLVTEALQWLSSRPTARVLDIGTGSGAIAIAIARHAPQSTVVGSDVSAAALAVARRNAIENDVANIAWRQGDLFDVVHPDERFDLVLSNPPYVSPQEYEGLEPNVRNYEPRLALVAENSGLDVLRQLCGGAHHVLTPAGALGVEIGSTQGETVATLMQENGFETVRVVADLAAHPRVVWGQ